MANRRQVQRDIKHAIEHIENEDLGMAINLLQGTLKREIAAKRKTDDKKEGDR